MAKHYSTRRKAETSPRRLVLARAAVPGVGRVRSGVRSGAQQPKGRSAVRWSGMESELIVRLQKIARLLKGVYSSCVAAELALRGQNAERDFEILQALRMHVSGPVSRQVEELDAVVGALAPGGGGDGSSAVDGESSRLIGAIARRAWWRSCRRPVTYCCSSGRLLRSVCGRARDGAARLFQKTGGTDEDRRRRRAMLLRGRSDVPRLKA